MKHPIKLALLGQPNSGKSTIFNTLTGSHQHVGNWPGKTVERKEGRFSHNKKDYLIVDLPGSYSLSANSDEEIITRDYIADGNADLVLILADGSQLERSLYMLADYVGITTPAMLVVTMIDVATDQGKTIDLERLSTNLNMPVAGIVATDKKTYGSFFKILEKALTDKHPVDDTDLYQIYKSGSQSDRFQEAMNMVSQGHKGFSREWLAGKLIEQDEAVIDLIDQKVDDEQVAEYLIGPITGALYTSECKFKWISAKLDGVVTKTKEPSKLLTKFDRLAISRRWGKPLAIFIIVIGIAMSFVIAGPIMMLAGVLPKVLNPLIDNFVASGMSVGVGMFLQGTIVNAIYWTVAMLGFVFGVTIVFGFLEEVGYMARVSYAFDGSMAKIGLQGKSIMPLLVSLGCTIGGAAGTRVIDSWGQRLLTIALAWAVPCAATFAVIPTLATAFFGWAGILVMILLFVIALIHIRITARVFGRKLAPLEERHGLIMELPPYHKPRWGMLIRQTLNKIWGIFKKAFFVILVISVIFYFLAYSPSGGVEGSILYKIGTAIEPVTRIFGMGWQTFISFISSMVSKEAVLGVLSAIFSGTGNIFDSTVGTAAASADLGTILVSSISKAEALAFMIAVTFNIPCLMAVTSTYQESHSLKWTMRIALYYFATALVLSALTYHVANIFI
ncbi:MAG: ferrous iron transport protein B [Fastidiosipilaceae bacterium]|jgi:ferrous iron transport protein B|nr:ferrous iron transport protein B [Clostridiaceae bacterium]